MTQVDAKSIQNFGQNMFDLVACLTGDYDKALKMAAKAIYSHTGQHFPVALKTIEGKSYQLVLIIN